MFNLPAKPSIELKEKKPDARQFSVVPLRAIHDKRLTRGDLINLMALCSYCSPNGFTFAAWSTIALFRGCSSPNICRGMKKLERLGYYEQVKKGYTGLRGALKRVIYDDSLTSQDQESISNQSIDSLIQEAEPMARYSKASKQTVNKQASSNTVITFEQALLVCSHSLKTDSDLLTLERLVYQGITLSQLKAAYNIV
jgi:hypothetical protein